jgi:hypothetical protein
MGSIANIIKYSKKAKFTFEPAKLNPKNWNWQKIIWPFRVITHPIQAFTEIKYEKRGSILLSILILALWTFSTIFKFLEEGFQFNVNRVEDLQFINLFMSSSAIIILWCISNWAICTLMDGEGWFKEIWICNCYAVMPQVLTIIPLTVISKFVTIDEGAFISIATTVVFGWMVLLMFIANTTVHQYSFGKSLLSMALTVIGVLILLLLAILIMSLFFEMYDFVKTIYQELVFRIKF